jgi:hypothetical protein
VTRAASAPSATAAAVERALDALSPLLATLLADRSISAERAMHVVVMDPDANRHTTAFDKAILCERSFGEPARWEADYAWYARAKARVAWREQASLRDLLAHAPQRLRDDDIRVEGAVFDQGLVVAASGAQPWYDHAIACCAIALIGATLRHASEVAASDTA